LKITEEQNNIINNLIRDMNDKISKDWLNNKSDWTGIYSKTVWEFRIKSLDISKER